LVNVKLLRRLAVIALAVALSACSIDVSGLTPAPTHAPAATAPLIAPTFTLAPTPTLTVATLPPRPTSARPGSSSTAVATSANPAQPQATPFSKPVTWADQHLEGKLIFTAGTEGVLQFDLATGTVSSLFTPPDQINSWVVASAVYSSAAQLVMAYAPPPVGGDIQFGYTELYNLPPGGKPPLPLFAQVPPKESFFDPTWSPDGKWLYYVHLTAPVTQTDTSRFSIERLAYPGGQPAVVVADAFWPRVSPSGQQMAFVHYDYNTGQQTLYVAKTDGSQPRLIALPPTFQSSDSPVFTPDEKNIIFSGITGGSPALSWLDQLTGVHTAYADGSPADWWSVPVAGGEPHQMTHISDSSMYATYAPDGQHIAYISASGLFVMKPDGSDIVPLLSITDLPGSVGTATVDWIR
jgi:WD40-like Beta Propeller Repeat